MAYGADLNFSFFQPTRVVFGDGVVSELALECKRLGIERALVVTDRVMRERTDVVARVEKALGARLGGIYDGVIPDTGVEVIDDGARLAKERGCDGLVSVGGGSAIDTAKGMAIVLTEGGSIRDHQGSSRLSRRQTPHIAVPTTAGTGSEVSLYIVVKDQRAHEKMHFMDDRIIPDAAILDPSVTLGMPAQLTAATGMDALTHAIEAYTSINKNPIADGLALQAMRLIARHLPRAVAEPQRQGRARADAASPPTSPGMAFNSTGVGLVHAMAHVVGARHGVHHGTANAICLPHVIRFNADELGALLPRRRRSARRRRARSRRRDGRRGGGASGGATVGARASCRRGCATSACPRAISTPAPRARSSDGAIVYNGKFAADKELVLGVYRNAY